MTDEQIHNLFKQRYNQANWKQFLFKAFANTRLLAKPEILTGIDSNVASQVQKLGYITLNENGIDRQIAVYEVTLAQGIILERNRVGLRNLLRKYWKDIDAAFIAYHRHETPNWRFTYVSELTGYDADGEFVKIKTEPKRYTYVLGEGESTRTAAERFTAIASKGSKATLDDVKEAFSVEKLSKAFFDEYKKHYDIFCDFMVSKPNIRQTIFNGDEKGIRDFNKKLLGRIVFLYFIQKKGWLGVPSKSDWGKGDFDFLTNLFNNTKNPDLFYSELLSKLFFDILNTKRKDDLIELVKGEPCRIPYLNGGLFEEDDKKHRNLIFPANLFKSLFDFLNKYNFTIYEDDPNDHTVAVDPEMLGHIFENLLEDNKDKGAFYTPKEIVHYMCQESIIEYLCTALQVEPEDQERIAVTNLLKRKEIDVILKPEIKNINTALDNVKICDPAIGSGAFPMGLLLEIFTAKQTLHTFEHGNTKTFDAQAVKLNIIQNSIYGVDIEKGAVDIARLRFWLSLIVDEPEPKALPNLDYKVVVGNSLVSKLGDDIIDIDWEVIAISDSAKKMKTEIQKNLTKLFNIQKEYFNYDGNKEKLQLEIRNLKIDLLISQLSLDKYKYSKKNTISGSLFDLTAKEKVTEVERRIKVTGFDKTIRDLQILKDNPLKPLHFFDWELDFPEVMNDNITKNKGYDIVIGNPPYGATLNSTDKSFLQSKYQTAKTIKGVQKGSSDTFTLFIELGHNLAKTGGNLHYIVPISITSSDSMTGIHRLIESDCSEIKVSSYSVRPQPVFENAVVDVSILYFKKDGKPCERIYTTKMYRKNSELNLKYLVDNLEFIEAKGYKIQGRYPKISLDIERKILSKIFASQTKIGDLLEKKGKSIFYRTSGGRYFKIVTNYSTGSTKERELFFGEKLADSVGAILSSNLYFWFYQIFSNNHDLKSYEIETFGIPFKKIDAVIISKLESVYSEYLKDIEKNSNVRQTTKYANIDSFKEYKIGKSKHLIDKIDDIIGPLYGLTNEEINFIKKYEINFRIQDE
jgi:hypothetical protein